MTVRLQCLGVDDAVEIGELLEFLGRVGWLTTVMVGITEVSPDSITDIPHP